MTREEYDERAAKGEKLGWVYFIEASPTGPIKVGWARDPVRRLNQLQTAQPDELSLIGVIPGTRHLEADLHRRLSIGRISGEWFDRWRTLRLVKPVIASHGFMVSAQVDESRTIPELARIGKRRQRLFVTKVE